MQSLQWQSQPLFTGGDARLVSNMAAILANCFICSAIVGPELHLDACIIQETGMQKVELQDVVAFPQDQAGEVQVVAPLRGCAQAAPPQARAPAKILRPTWGGSRVPAKQKLTRRPTEEAKRVFQQTVYLR